jgi:hypothetical protein
MVPQQKEKKEPNSWAKNERKNPWGKKTNNINQRNFVPKVNEISSPNFSPKINHQQQPTTNRIMKRPAKQNNNIPPGWNHHHGHKKPSTLKAYCNKKQLPLEPKMKKQNSPCNSPEAGISMDSIFEEEEIKTRGKNIKKNS